MHVLAKAKKPEAALEVVAQSLVANPELMPVAVKLWVNVKAKAECQEDIFTQSVLYFFLTSTLEGLSPLPNDIEANENFMSWFQCG